jgi:hypothetical protein
MTFGWEKGRTGINSAFFFISLFHDFNISLIDFYYSFHSGD